MDNVLSQRNAIVVTGQGVINAIAADYETFVDNLLLSRSGIERYKDVLGNWDSYLGLVKSVPELPAGISGDYDRTTILAAKAAIESLKTANLWHEELTVPSHRVALLLGTSHGGRSQLDHFVNCGMPREAVENAEAVLNIGAHNYQTCALAAMLGIHGPTLTLSTACSSSGTAIVHGIDLLRSGKVDVVVAGGADAFSQLTLAGFRALGALATKPCGPFSETIGITLGEGAAFVVLERTGDALARKQAPLFELYGASTTWDAYHLTAPEPTGDGMRRAIDSALNESAIQPYSIGYISAHGTGTRANDSAESLAITQVFGTGTEPPVSSIKSFTGHTLGASAVTGMLAAFAGMNGGWLPPTVNFSGTRAGCSLNYIPNEPKPSRFDRFLSLSAAFGGCNCAIVAGLPTLTEKTHASPIESCNAVITGLGVLSPLGIGAQSISNLADDCRPSSYQGDNGKALVPGFEPRSMLPPGTSGRLNRVTQLAIAAVEQALEQAGWSRDKRCAQAMGLMVALSKGAVSSYESYLNSVCGGLWDKASPTSFPHLVMSSVGGQVALACGLKGAASTLIGEGESGLATLGLAVSSLSRLQALDAIVVLAADELTPLFLDLEHTLNGDKYGVPAEGAVALVIEREESALARKANTLASITGWGQTFGSPSELNENGLMLAAREALAQSGLTSSDLGMVVTAENLMSNPDSVNPLSEFFNSNDSLKLIRSFPAELDARSAFSGLLSVSRAISAFQKEKCAAQYRSTCLPAMIVGSGSYGSNNVVIVEPRNEIEGCQGETYHGS